MRSLLLALFGSIVFDSPREDYPTFFVEPPGELIGRMPATWQKGLLSDDEREIIAEMALSDPMSALRRLGRIANTGSTVEVRDLARSHIAKISNWQGLLDDLLYQLHLGSQDFDPNTREHRSNAHPLPRWVKSAHDIGRTQGGIFGLLGDIAEDGSADAVLLAAPYLFCHSPRSTDGTFCPTEETARTTMRGGQLAGFPRPNGVPMDVYSDRCRQWWLDHARDFGARPPASIHATLEEVRELNRAALKRGLRISAQSILTPTTTGDAIRIDQPGATKPDRSVAEAAKTEAGKSMRKLAAIACTALIAGIAAFLWRLRRQRSRGAAS